MEEVVAVPSEYSRPSDDYWSHIVDALKDLGEIPEDHFVTNLELSINHDDFVIVKDYESEEREVTEI